MKITNGLLIGFAVLIIAIGFFACKANSRKKTGDQANNVKETKLKDNPYIGIRTQAINTTPEELQLTTLSDSEIYGIIMDLNRDKAIITVTSFKTGDASIYMSTGQGFIGGIGHETIKNAAKNFVSLGEKYLSKARKTEQIDPAGSKKIDFYFLTKSGKYYLEEKFSKIENNQSGLIELFNSANQVITEYRLISEKK